MSPFKMPRRPLALTALTLASLTLTACGTATTATPTPAPNAPVELLSGQSAQSTSAVASRPTVDGRRAPTAAQKRAAAKRAAAKRAAAKRAAAKRAAAKRAAAKRAAAARRNANRPNVLLITVDDAAPDNLRYMPNVRKLIAAQGVQFTNAISPTPICVPARASLLTGQYAANHGARTIGGANGGFKAFKDRETLPVWLQRSGYDTMFVGKYLNGYGPERGYYPPGWTDWRGTVENTTYNYVAPRVNHNGRLQVVRQYNTDLFSNYTLSQLRDPRRKQKPWFMMVNYVAPHDGGPRESDDPAVVDPRRGKPFSTPHVAPRHRNKYRHLNLPNTPDMFEVDVTDKATASGAARRFDSVQRKHLREKHQQRVESLMSVDEAVGKAITTLRTTGQINKTHIIFVSDNGYLLGQHNKLSKLHHYTQSLQVPMVMRGPGIPKKRVATAVTLPDVATTIAAIAGAKPRIAQDGVNFLPYINAPYKDRIVPIRAWAINQDDAETYRGVRTGRYTYIRYPNGEEELFDRQKDPYELRNLARVSSAASTLKTMRAFTARYDDCGGFLCRKQTFR